MKFLGESDGVVVGKGEREMEACTCVFLCE